MQQNRYIKILFDTDDKLIVDYKLPLVFQNSFIVKFLYSTQRIADFFKIDGNNQEVLINFVLLTKVLKMKMTNTGKYYESENIELMFDRVKVLNLFLEIYFQINLKDKKLYDSKFGANYIFKFADEKGFFNPINYKIDRFGTKVYKIASISHESGQPPSKSQSI